MRSAVIGGTGEIGSLVVAELAARGDEVRAVSRRAPAPGSVVAALLDGRVEHRRADLASGDGLAEALDGVEVVVNAVADRRGRAAVMVDGTRRLLAAEAAAGVGHHIAISIVGCDRSAFGFHRTTAAQERALTEGPVAWSIQRATQFHTLLAALFAATARVGVAPGGRGRLQPIDPAVVARRIAEIAHAGPSGRLPDIAGPEVRTVGELAADWRAQTGRRLLALTVPGIGSLGRALHNGVLCAPDAAVPGATFAQWLAQDGADVAASVRR